VSYTSENKLAMAADRPEGFQQSRVMDSKRDEISTLEFKELVTDLLNFSPHNVCIRFRVIGEMWQTNFVRVVLLEGKRVISHDEHRNSMNSIQDINDVIQFELDTNFKGYQAHFHYSVAPAEFRAKH